MFRINIKEEAEKIISKITSDKDFQSKFMKDPIKAIEDLLGVDLPDGMTDKIADMVKSNLSSKNDKSNASKIDLGDITSKLGGLFNKKD